MATRDDYVRVAKQITDHLNAFHLAFKTYNVDDFDKMIKAVAGDGSRVTGNKTGEQLQTMLLERGFMIFPSIADSEDGYVRVIRANSIVANLLSALRYPGPNGDEQLARLLVTIKNRPRPDSLEGESSSAGE